MTALVKVLGEGPNTDIVVKPSWLLVAGFENTQSSINTFPMCRGGLCPTGGTLTIGKHSLAALVPKPITLRRVNFKLFPKRFIAPTMPCVPEAHSVPVLRSHACKIPLPPSAFMADGNRSVTGDEPFCSVISRRL